MQACRETQLPLAYFGKLERFRCGAASSTPCYVDEERSKAAGHALETLLEIREALHGFLASCSHDCGAGDKYHLSLWREELEGEEVCIFGQSIDLIRNPLHIEPGETEVQCDIWVIAVVVALFERGARNVRQTSFRHLQQSAGESCS